MSENRHVRRALENKKDQDKMVGVRAQKKRKVPSMYESWLPIVLYLLSFKKYFCKATHMYSSSPSIGMVRSQVTSTYVAKEGIYFEYQYNTRGYSATLLVQLNHDCAITVPSVEFS